MSVLPRPAREGASRPRARADSTAAILGLFYFLSLYLQQILGYSAITAGLSQLPLAVGTIIAAGLASPLVSRYGTRRLLVSGLALFAAGLVWFAQLRSGWPC